MGIGSSHFPDESALLSLFGEALLGESPLMHSTLAASYKPLLAPCLLLRFISFALSRGELIASAYSLSIKT